MRSDSGGSERITVTAGDNLLLPISENHMTPTAVWVFCANGSALPSGIFSNERTAEAWITKHHLSGVLTEYPIDEGVYEWAIAGGHFTPRFPSQVEPSFVGRFTSAYLPHCHFADGQRRT